ncbi:MAG: DUF1329 domain-containing protein [Thermodesulfobacteriota bacterium]|nr:DUF1329 domain-containing protein [Thermodesulfobacteriota bacterium]
MKRLIFVLLFLAMPDFISANEIKPGIVITKANYEKYKPELKKLLSPVTFTHYVNGLKNGWITMPIVKTGDYLAPDGYLKLTASNTGKYKVGENNRLIGLEEKSKLIGWPWRGGAPFPDPETGTELGWDIYYRYACNRDEFQLHNDFNYYNNNGSMERKIVNYFFGKVFNGRCTIPPIPEIPGNNGLVHWKVAMLVTEPFDVKGFIMLRINYEDIFKPDDVFTYIPALRRLRRLTGADVTDPMLGSDACYDDFEMWQQKFGPELVFHEPLVGNLLVNKFTNIYDFPGRRKGWIKGNCFQTDWEIRPVWIMSVDMNMSDYNYSKRVFYIEKEDRTFLIHAEDNYDMKGRLWKGANAVGVTIQPGTRQRTWHGGMYKNHISGHTSLSDFSPIEPKLDQVRIPYEFFSVKGLLRKAR